MHEQNIVLADSYGVTTHKRGTRQQVVHQGFILEFALKVSGVTQTIPRLNTYEGSLLAIRTPEGNDRGRLVHRYCRLTSGIHQHSTMGLALMNLHRVVTEEVVAKLQNTHISLQGDLHHIVAAVSITLQRVHRLLIVQLNHTLQLTARYVKGGVTTYLEVNLLRIGILYVPDDVHLVTLQTIGNSQVEAEGVNLQRLF